MAKDVLSAAVAATTTTSTAAAAAASASASATTTTTAAAAAATTTTTTTTTAPAPAPAPALGGRLCHKTLPRKRRQFGESSAQDWQKFTLPHLTPSPLWVSLSDRLLQ